jgi:hypothetical protein
MEEEQIAELQRQFTEQAEQLALNLGLDHCVILGTSRINEEESVMVQGSTTDYWAIQGLLSQANYMIKGA